MTRSLNETLHGESPESWAVAFLELAGFPVTSENLRAVVSWEYAESSGGGGDHNPLNTTQGGYPGETDFNSVGVKNYVHRSDGLNANAKVIHNGYYTAAVALFRAGNNARATCDAITRSPWGTGYITLRGAPPVPVPTTGVEMALVASPHKPTITGRTAAAVWNPAHPNEVILTNGASIAQDQPHGQGVRRWAPPLSPGRHGIGITAEVGPDGKPNGKGIVLQDDAGGTFNGRWS